MMDKTGVLRNGFARPQSKMSKTNNLFLDSNGALAPARGRVCPNLSSFSLESSPSQGSSPGHSAIQGVFHAQR